VSARYRALLRAPGFARLLSSSILARLPSGMLSLALLLLVRARTGSFLAAGAAVGIFTLAGAAAGPALGAAVDRRGQTRVLLLAACAQAVALVALTLVAQRAASQPAVFALAAIAGGVQPPIAGCVRALWSQVAPEAEALDTAYALDATTQELIWILGPIIVASTVTLASPTAAMLVCAAVTLLGSVYFASSKTSRGWRAAAHVSRRTSALASGALRRLMLTVLCSGATVGMVELGLPAFASTHSSRWSAGALLALFSIGSMLGGIAYASRSWRADVLTRYCGIMLALAAAIAPLVVASTLAVAFPLSLLAGLLLAPMITVQLSLVGSLAPRGTSTEAFTWHRGAFIGGTAAGSALAGAAVQARGVAYAFALACAAMVAAAVLASAWRAELDPSDASSQVGPGGQVDGSAAVQGS
jgi:predicted MFS family arabinose efflux permease